jgi:hypothetical protein
MARRVRVYLSSDAPYPIYDLQRVLKSDKPIFKRGSILVDKILWERYQKIEAKYEALQEELAALLVEPTDPA